MQRAQNARPQYGLTNNTESLKQVREITLCSGKDLNKKPTKATKKEDGELVPQ